jgi:hypothetical protein
MSFDLQKILESKLALRRKLAALPVAEKLRMLDALRQRTLDIRGGTIRQGHGALHEKPVPYRPEPQ